MGLVLLALLLLTAVAGLLGWTADSRQYANWRNSDMPGAQPRW